MIELTTFHAMNTHDLVDILINDGFSTEEKNIASQIVKERIHTMHIKLNNVLSLLGRKHD